VTTLIYDFKAALLKKLLLKLPGDRSLKTELMQERK
jgi:hypothetical protein